MLLGKTGPSRRVDRLNSTVSECPSETGWRDGPRPNHGLRRAQIHGQFPIVRSGNPVAIQTSRNYDRRATGPPRAGVVDWTVVWEHALIAFAAKLGIRHQQVSVFVQEAHAVDAIGVTVPKTPGVPSWSPGLLCMT
jgi:hypothetical protein